MVVNRVRRRRTIVRGAVGAFALAIAAVAAATPEFPSKPLRLVVPYAPGGATDLMARLLQEPLSRALGQRIIVDNKSGAAGAIGTREVARAEPDGYTLLLGNNGPHTVLPSLSESVGYDGVNEFAAVASLGTTPLLLIANPNLPVHSAADLVEYARTRHGDLAYASSGIGSMSHLATEQFLLAAKIAGVHVPYKGQAPTLNAILGGEVQFAIVSPSPMLSELASQGRIKILGVSTPVESPAALGVAPIAKIVPGYEVEVWFGVFAPAGTPRAILERLRQAAAGALQASEVGSGLRRIGAVSSSRSPQQLIDAMVGEKAMWASVIRQKGIRAE